MPVREDPDGAVAAGGRRLAVVRAGSGEAGLTLGIRAEDLELGDEPGAGTLEGRVRMVEDLGADKVGHVEVLGHDLLARPRGPVGLEPGDACHVRLPADRLHLFDSSGRRIRAGTD